MKQRMNDRINIHVVLLLNLFWYPTDVLDSSSRGLINNPKITTNKPGSSMMISVPMNMYRDDDTLVSSLPTKLTVQFTVPFNSITRSFDVSLRSNRA